MIFYEDEIIEKIHQKNKENFDNLGGVEMSTYKENVNNDLESKKNKVLEKLKEIDEKYSLEEFTPNEITSLGLEKKEYDAPTNDEILKQAEESLKSQKENDLKEIETNYSSKFLKLDNEVSDAKLEREDDLEAALKEYKSNLKSTTNNSIKKGISRSSIFDEAVKAIENDSSNKIKDIENEFSREIKKLEQERNILEQQKENALSNFDISYAVKLENKIGKIVSEIEKQQKEVEKYNSNIDKQEEEHRLAQEKANQNEQKRVEKHNQEVLDLQEKLGETEFANLRNKERYDVVLDYLMNIPKDVAMAELKKDNSYETLLGNYYPAVYSQVLKRKDWYVGRYFKHCYI